MPELPGQPDMQGRDVRRVKIRDTVLVREVQLCWRNI